MKIQKSLQFNPMRVNPITVCMIVFLMLVNLSGCEKNDTPGSESEQQTGNHEITLDVNKFAISQDAEMKHYVGTVDDSLFIGIADSDYSSEEESRTIAVYLCNSMDVSQWLFKDINGQQATLDAGGTSVDLTIMDENISGTLTTDNEASQAFTANLANGFAGIYRAEYSLGGIQHNIDWIVLPDGRQRGPLDGKGNDMILPPPPNLN